MLQDTREWGAESTRVDFASRQRPKVSVFGVGLHTVWAEGLVSLCRQLADDIEIILESPISSIVRIENHPEVTVLALIGFCEHEKEKPWAAIESIAQHPRITAAVLACDFDAVSTRRALQAGAQGVLWSGMTPEGILAALRLIHAGKLVVSQPFSRLLATDEPLPGPPLAEVDLRTLRLMAQGADTNAISNELAMSLSTAKRHIRRLLRKLGVSSKAEALVMAAKQGWV